MGINLEKLWTLVSEKARADSTAAKAAVIDVTKAGYFKVLGKGELPKAPCVVRAKNSPREPARESLLSVVSANSLLEHMTGDSAVDSAVGKTSVGKGVCQFSLLCTNGVFILISLASHTIFSLYSPM